MTGIIVCNGSIDDYAAYKKYFDSANLIICADGGASHLKRFGIKPHILLGDFDSISKADFEFFNVPEVEVLKFPVEKDMTDTEIAVEIAVDRGVDQLIIIGGIGTRLDHSLSNVFLLKKMLDRGVKGIIVNECNEITLINDRICIEKEKDAKISLLPISERVEGVTTQGLYYPLDNATMTISTSWGVSNEFAGDIAEVSIKSGLLLVIKSKEQ